MANKYFVFSGTNYSTGLTANWATYSGGAGGNSLPGPSDSIYFDINSPTCSADLTIASVSNVTFNGYFNTFNFYTQSFNWIIYNNLTFSPSQSWGSYSNTANLILGYGAGTVSTNGSPWYGNLIYYYLYSYNFNDNFICYGNLSFLTQSGNNSALGIGLNSGTISLYGNISLPNSGAKNGSQGYTVINLLATQSIYCSFSTATNAYFSNPIYINLTSSATASFTGNILNSGPNIFGSGFPKSGIFYRTGNINMNNLSYEITGFEYSNSNYPIYIDLNNNYLNTLNISYNTYIYPYYSSINLVSPLSINNLIAGTGNGSATIYGATFSVNNLTINSNLWLGITGSMYISGSISHTGKRNSHALISAAFYGYGTTNSYIKPTIVLSNTFSTSYLDLVQINITGSTIYTSSGIILNSTNAYNLNLPVYFIGTNSNNIWGATSNWSYNSGGTANAGFIPDSGDIVLFNSNSGTCSLDSNVNCYNIDFTGYSNTINMSYSLNIWNNLTLSQTMSFAGNGTMSIYAQNSNIKTNGKQINIPLSILTPQLFIFNMTYSYPFFTSQLNLNDNITSTNTTYFNTSYYNGTFPWGTYPSNTNLQINNNYLYMNNYITCKTAIISGSTTFSFGASVLSTDSSNNGSQISNNVLINAGSGTFTMSNSISILNSSWKYISGTTYGGTFYVSGTCSLDLNSSTSSSLSLSNNSGMNISNLFYSYESIVSENINYIYVTLPSQLTCISSIAFNYQYIYVNIIGQLYVGANIVLFEYNSGTANISNLNYIGSGYISTSSYYTAIPINITIQNLNILPGSNLSFTQSSTPTNNTLPAFTNTNINVNGGTLNLLTNATNSFYLSGTSSFNIISGTVTGIANANFGYYGSSYISINTPNFKWNNFNIYNNATYNLNSQLNSSYLMYNAGSLTSLIIFTGSYGFNVDNFYHNTTGNYYGSNNAYYFTNIKYYLNYSTTYSVNNSLQIINNSVGTGFYTGNSATSSISNPAIFIIGNSARINANYLNVSNIDFSKGLTFRFFRGYIYNCKNALAFNITDYSPFYYSGNS